MPTKGHFWARGFALAVSGVALCTQAVAAVVSPQAPKIDTSDASAWSAVRSDLETGKSAGRLDNDLRAFVVEGSKSDQLETVVSLSYSMAGAHQIAALDKLWINTLSTRADSDAMETYLSVRSAMVLPGQESGDAYLQNWVWKTTDSPGCDSD